MEEASALCIAIFYLFVYGYFNMKNSDCIHTSAVSKMLGRPIEDVIKLVDASGVDEEVIIQLVEASRFNVT